jgi:hypothetical protein
MWKLYMEAGCMPRVGGYIPDELWQDAQRALPGAGTSALLQEGLKRLLKHDDGFAMARPKVDHARLTRIVEKLRVEADDEYQKGYERGLRLLEPRPGKDTPVVSWSMLDMLTEDWDVFAWIGRIEDASGGDEDDLREVMVYGGANGDPLGGPARSSAFLAGLTAALKEVWLGVTQSLPPATGSTT